ncbi:MAG: lipopolysaccharide biosynthesis protein [Candidatus Bathyarchaeia archaeon]
MANSRVTVARSATSLYIANVVVLVSNTLYFLILTNILRSTLGVGIVTALNLMIWFLVTVCLLAQPVTMQSPIPAPLAVLKFIPELIARKARSGAARMFMLSFGIAAAIALGIGAVLIASPSVVAPLLGGTAVLPIFIQLAAVDVILLSLDQVCFASLIAVGEMRRATIYIILWSAARYILASIFLLHYTITGVLVGWIMGDGVLLAVALRRTIGTFGIARGGAEFSVAEFVKYSSITFVSALIGYAVNQADKLFTLAQQGLPQLAIYNVAIVAASFSGMAPYALTTVLLPALSSLHAANEVQEIRQLVRLYSRYVAIIVIPVAFGFASITAVALRIFGPAYVSGLVPSVIVSLTSGLTAVGAVYAAVLLAVGELKWYTGANVVGLGSLAVVAYLATPVLGLSGPALGRASLMVLAALVYGYAALRSGFFELDVRAFVCAAASSLIMGAVVFFGLSLFHTFLTKLVLVPAFVAVGALVYLGCLRALSVLQEDDLEFIRDMAPERLHPLVAIVARIAGVSSTA